MSCLTAVFCVIIVIYNFSSEPPFGGFTALQSMAASVNPDSLFVSDSPDSSSPSSSVSSSQSASSAPGVQSKAVSSARQSSSRSASKPQVRFPINLNTATKEELTALPGIGDVIAQRIIDYRSQAGSFKSINELDNVKGIGEKIIAKIKSYITLGK